MSRRRPRPPGPLAGDPGHATSRFGAEVDLDDTFVQRLAGICAEVDTSRAERVEAGRDWWPLSVWWAERGSVPAVPGAVARPASAAEVAAVLAACRDAGVPVTPVAGRSGVCGSSVPAFGGVSLDLTALAGIHAVDDASLLVDVRPGTWGDEFEATLRGEHGLTAGHWPQSMAISTVGGWVACRGAGQYSTRYGKIEDIVVGLEVALADGRIVRTGGRAPRAAVGPDLTQLFVGSEGTLGVITDVRLRAHPVPTATASAAWGFASFADGLEACRRILRRGATPAVLRLYDHAESGRHFEGVDSCALIVMDESDPALVDATLGVVADECAPAEVLDTALVERWLARRNEVPSLASLAGAGIVADTVEIAARWSVLPAVYEAAVSAVSALDATLVVSAHQSHAYGDGACLYFSFAGRPERPQPGGAPPDLTLAEAYYCAAWDAITGAALERGGALSHHHGVGINRARHMGAALDGGLALLAALKAAFDPAGVLNPGKLGLPSRFGAPPWP
jgi:alkyldihydroxyacetonephosphate synthase